VIQIEKFVGHLRQATTNFSIITRAESRHLAGAVQTANIGAEYASWSVVGALGKPAKEKYVLGGRKP
jgi:hypothetical protein